MQQAPEAFFNLADFVPDLREQFQVRPLGPKKFLLAAIPVENPEGHPAPLPAITDRQSISLTDGKEFWFWEIESLRALFRGNKQPPALGDHPEAYHDAFIIFDLHVLEVSKFFGDRRDAEMKEIYSALRRRPDGKSLGFVHDYMWQAAALVLGTRQLSQAEFEAILARLERSCRTFELGVTSRNYVGSLRMTLGQVGGY
jgi:hypothetical protein